MDPNSTAEHLFWAYQHAKGRYRKFMNEPVRRVRRHLKRHGKGKGKSAGHFLATSTETELHSLFLAKGKGHKFGRKSSGKGKGRSQNPKGPDGQIMKCRTCGSTEHFQKNCPRGNSSSSGGNRPPNFVPYVNTPAYQEEDMGPLGEMLTSQHSGTEYFMM